MTTFRSRLSSMRNRRVIFACDYEISRSNGTVAGGVIDAQTALDRIICDVKSAAPYLCAIKLNFHLLLPLGMEAISCILDVAHQYGLQSIADIKLNDIGNTNRVATDILWNMGFDPVIVNPIMGLDSLRTLVQSAHKNEKGVVTLCHMSAPEAKTSYEMQVCAGRNPDASAKRMHEIFFQWALESKADGIIVGATYPQIIRDCATDISKQKEAGSDTAPYVISPGVGAQGASVADAMQSGSDYIIAGRSIIQSPDPAQAALSLYADVVNGLS